VTTTRISRDEAIREILTRHGVDAIYITSTGYVSRAVHELADEGQAVFYMQGSMGLAPAIGLGIALQTSKRVVVVNGDASLLMALGSTHTIRDHAPPTFFHYVLDNGCHESVGGQPCAPLERAYPGVTEIIKVERGGKPPRVAIAAPENTRRIREALAVGQAVRPATPRPDEKGDSDAA
jgi:thiamine pyrophosphate-dependent acetolactate synthase large subunit-like protein